MIRRKLKHILLAASLVCGIVTASADASYHHVHHRHHHQSTARKVAGVAAPIGIGAAFGPAGSISYQAVKHRRGIKHFVTGHHHG